MKIAVNTRLLLKNKLEGIGWFTFETFKRITINHPEHEFFFIFDRKFSNKFIFSPNITPVIISPQARHPILFYSFYEYAIPKLLKKINADMFISPDGFASLATKVRTLLTIHDLNFVHSPDNIPFLTRRYYKCFVPSYAKKAERIVTVSEFSKTDISRQLGIPSEKIDVVYNGANQIFTPLEKKDIFETKKKYTNGEEYFIFIGALHPRKNLVRLLKAFDVFKEESQSNVKFLVVGSKMFKTKEIFTTYRNLNYRKDVIFLDHLQPVELKMVLGSAFTLVFASTFEGFGIPIIEAMQCDIPVITSNITSMPEIAGDAALLVDPFSVDSIIHAMLELYNNSILRNELIQKGRMQCKKFSWDKTADKMWNSIEKCLN